ncbi:pyrroline-5-carboxylate reductase [Nitrospirales bacterium NOB]|nr:MAG: pyrroline-5-carboxylate reductase [Nitrospira sp. OLB3]MBV6471106.1 Pyrroline-5-carboxylate reductase [Nitrospirota bacterium]MDL1889927.1 pyrroline-5-carboxylate reductase [Nitrospirales bacterium NOB]MEB2339010.1 pyrroline-5-carboxylate reductase [Nitrospirales bacterium]QOJ37146.1 MAG: pyrroline-5-carboxylate reductase [Nitrospira sp.]
MLPKRVVFLGGGQMAEALIGGLLAAGGAEAVMLTATDPVAARRDRLAARFGIKALDDNRSAVSDADLVVLAVKPQAMPAVLGGVGNELSGKLVVSIAAGVTTAWIRERAADARGIVRAMPNTPALVRAGVTALAYSADLQAEDVTAARTLFEAVGAVVSVEERLMDAVTGLSGSGPAYVFVAIEALADGGVKMGLPRATAQLLAAQTVLGAARMLLDRGEHPACLKDQVASPGGTTIAGLHALEAGGLRGCLMAAVEAATNRSQELGRSCL